MQTFSGGLNKEISCVKDMFTAENCSSRCILSSVEELLIVKW